MFDDPRKQMPEGMPQGPRGGGMGGPEKRIPGSIPSSGMMDQQPRPDRYNQNRRRMMQGGMGGFGQLGPYGGFNPGLQNAMSNPMVQNATAGGMPILPMLRGAGGLGSLPPQQPPFPGGIGGPFGGGRLY